MRFQLSLNLNSELALVATVRLLCCQALSGLAVPEADIHDVETMVGELATNAVLHSRSPYYRVDIELYGRVLFLTVTDHGVGFQRDCLPEIGTERTVFSVSEKTDTMAPSPACRFGGWGIPLVESLADSVEYSPNYPHGATIRVCKYLKAG